ncbi:hypothetical protein [Arthrobacter rhizosphaerae]|uniref:hypothetical protein n=1 Tax=Arthrobacter rhizosphaerae TaxID=2855490 RepID=UPI001FF4906C|nr:hypothetical protein [Arthrobacter rhizosphaerae]
MFKSTRAIVGLCLVGGVSLATVIGWSTGFFSQVAAFVGGLWTGFTTWLSSPFGWDHVIAGAGVLLIPVAILVAIFIVVDS